MIVHFASPSLSIAGPMIDVALSSHLTDVLSDLPDTERERIVRAIRKIQNQQFDSGLRVKKLKSRPRVAVWEARFSSGGRLLFTYGEHPHRTSNGPMTVAHCWTAVLDHDEVPRELRRKQFDAPETMEWLAAETVEEILWDDRPFPENPGADLEAIEDDFPEPGERWDAYAALSSEYPPMWTTPPENLPWYLEGPVAFEMWAEEHDVPAELILTEEQIDLLQKPLPMFLNGPAGSGKTTLALYRLLTLQEHDPEAKLAFITQNPRLVRHAEDLYTALPNRPTDSTPVDFLTYQGLVAEVLDIPLDRLRRECVPVSHLSDLLAHRDLTGAERQLFETEIRAVLKGMVEPSEGPVETKDIRPMLSREDYRALPARWSVVREARRNEAYRLAEQYQRNLKTQGDDLQDLSTQALRRLFGGAQSRRYDALVLDEVQDLTEKQIRVAMATLQRSSRDQVLLAGDPTQTLNGSGFGWRVPQALFYERQDEVPSPVTLTRSFRAGAPTLRLPRALADRLRSEGADVVSLDPGKARGTGARPVRVPPGDPVDDVLMEGHPDVLVLTQDDDMAVQLRAEWGHPFVWSVAQAKGLEAAHVVLYRLPDRFRALPGAAPAQREAARRSNHYHLRLHYVGATRARKSITAVARPHPGGSLWDDPAVQEVIETPPAFNAPWNEAPPVRAWRRRAEYYRDQEQWAAAAECFRNADEPNWATICDALSKEGSIGSSDLSSGEAPLSLTRAQASFLLHYTHRLDGWPVHIELLRLVGRDDEADALQKQHDAAIGNWASVARYYQHQNDYERAADLFVKAENWEKAALCFKRQDKHEWARVCDALDRYDEATAVVEAVRQTHEQLSKSCAVFLLEQVGPVDDPQTEIWLLEHAGKNNQLRQKKRAIKAKRDEANGSWQAAARYYRGQNDYRRAADLFVKAKNWEEAATCFKQRGKHEWVRVCDVLDQHDEATAVVRVIRRTRKKLSEPCAAFLLNQVDEIHDIEAEIWLLKRAGEHENANRLVWKNKQKLLEITDPSFYSNELLKDIVWAFNDFGLFEVSLQLNSTNPHVLDKITSVSIRLNTEMNKVRRKFSIPKEDFLTNVSFLTSYSLWSNEINNKIAYVIIKYVCLRSNESADQGHISRYALMHCMVFSKYPPNSKTIRKIVKRDLRTNFRFDQRIILKINRIKKQICKLINIVRPM